MRRYVSNAELKVIDPEKMEKRRERRRRERLRALERNPDLDRKYNREKYLRHKDKFDKRNAKWRDSHPGVNIEYQRTRKQNKRALYILQSIRRRAKEKNVLFDISLEWIQQRLDRGICEVTGFRFDISGHNGRTLPSIDRKEPGGDYIESNCRMVLRGVNSSIGPLGNKGVDRIRSRLVMRGDVAHAI